MTTGKLSEVARHLVLPEGIVTTAWPAIRDTCSKLELTFDPWQDGAGRAILAKRADGLYAADTVVMSIPRQVGKTFLLASIAFALCIKNPNTTVIWTAHRFKTARETFMSLKGMAVRPVMAPHVDPDLIYSGSGNESIGFRNGSRIMFGARERGFGRGFSAVDVLVLDEAQILTTTAMEDMVPTTNAAPNPLILLTGTPPRPVDPGEVFKSLRSEVLDGTSEDVLYIELSADPDADPSDRAQWVRANPSYPARTNARAILRMRKNLTPTSFLREGLGVWDSDTTARFGIPQWDDTARDVRPEGPPVFFITMAKQMASATIAVAALHDGVPHAELADHRPGTAWATDRLIDLHEKHPGAQFAAFAAGPAKAWVPILAESGIELKLLTSTEAAAAYAHVKKLAETLAFTHSPDELVADALGGCEWKEAEGGGTTLDWRKSAGDVSPFAAEAGALWLLESSPAVAFFASRR